MNSPITIQEWAKSYFCYDIRLERINSGINNQVYLGQDGDSTVILKHFPVKKAFPDRFTAEFDFLTLANKLSPEYVPKLCKHDESERIMVLEFINGKQYSKTNVPNKDDIEGAIEFYIKINSSSTLCKMIYYFFAQS